MKHLLILSALLCGGPALADVWPAPNVPDPGRQPRPTTLSSATPATPPLLPWGGGPIKTDAEGTRYSPRDVALGFLPVPIGYRRSGGGFVRNWGGAPRGFLVPGIDTPATITRLMNPAPQPPATPSPTPTPQPKPDPEDPDKPAPPSPIPTEDVPGPLGLLAIAAGFHASRRLRQRLNG